MSKHQQECFDTFMNAAQVLNIKAAVNTVAMNGVTMIKILANEHTHIN